MYYDIDDILCEDHLIDCKLEIDLFKGAFLDKEAHTEDGSLEKGHVMKLPFWMAKILSEQEVEGSPVASIELVDIFENDFQQSLDANPVIIDLRRHSPYFYALGFKFADLIANEIRLDRYRGSIQLRGTLIETLKKRSLNILFELAHSRMDEQNGLTEDERENFRIIRKIQQEYEKWEERLNKRTKNDMTYKKLKL